MVIIDTTGLGLDDAFWCYQETSQELGEIKRAFETQPLDKWVVAVLKVRREKLLEERAAAAATLEERAIAHNLERLEAARLELVKRLDSVNDYEALEKIGAEFAKIDGLKTWHHDRWNAIKALRS